MKESFFILEHNFTACTFVLMVTNSLCKAWNGAEVDVTYRFSSSSEQNNIHIYVVHGQWLGPDISTLTISEFFPSIPPPCFCKCCLRFFTVQIWVLATADNKSQNRRQAAALRRPVKCFHLITFEKSEEKSKRLDWIWKRFRKRTKDKTRFKTTTDRRFASLASSGSTDKKRHKTRHGSSSPVSSSNWSFLIICSRFVWKGKFQVLLHLVSWAFL